MKSVSIITVNFNHSHVTDELLDSIYASNTYENIEIIVVDNGSNVNPVPEWKVKYPGVQFIRSATNLGFAGGNNLGIKISKGDYLFFVNNDTVFTEGLVTKLAGTLNDHPEAGIVSPKIRYFDQPDMLQYCGFSRMNYYTGRTTSIGQFEKDHGQFDKLTGETGFIHGAAMMVRREAIAPGGLMPEVYFLYYEEMDWCEQIKRAGYKIWINMQALIYHKESVSVGSKSPLKEYFMNRNRLLFIRRNCAPATKAVFWSYFILIVTPRNILGYIKAKQWNFIGILLRSIAWNMTNSTNSKHLGYPVNNKA